MNALGWGSGLPGNAGALLELAGDCPDVGGRAGDRLLVLARGEYALYRDLGTLELLRACSAQPRLAARLCGPGCRLLAPIPAAGVRSGDALFFDEGGTVTLVRDLAEDDAAQVFEHFRSVPPRSLALNADAEKTGLSLDVLETWLERELRPAGVDPEPVSAPITAHSDMGALFELLHQVGGAMPREAA